MILDLSGTIDGRQFLKQNEIILKSLTDIIQQNKAITLIQISLKFYINYSSAENIEFVLKHLPKIELLIKWSIDENNLFSDLCSFILSNISRESLGIAAILPKLIGVYDQIVDAYCNEKHNKQNKQLHYLGLLLSNLSTNESGRLAICNKNKNYFHRLISFSSHPVSSTRRRAAVQLIRNCCLDTKLHDWLLEDYDSQENYLIVKLLLPLCDGGDQMGEE